jgi:hypothetical protein
MENVAVGMGSNMGNRIENLSKGISLLYSNPKISIIKSSSIYRSDAKDFVGDYFFNTVIILKTTLTPLQLLSTFKQIESKFGKKIRNRDGKIENWEKENNQEYDYNIDEIIVKIRTPLFKIEKNKRNFNFGSRFKFNVK